MGFIATNRVYEGIGKNVGKFIYGDADARGLMYDQIGIDPANGWDDISPEFLEEFDRDMLDWFYSDDWIIWDSEEECLERPVSYDV